MSNKMFSVFCVFGGVILSSVLFYHVRGVSPNEVSKSVVSVLNLGSTSGGTGFAVKGRIVTNDHVCEVSKDGLVVVQEDSGKKHIKRVLRRSFIYDLCLIEGIEIPDLRLASKIPDRFDQLYVVGRPLLSPNSPSQGVYIGDELSQIALPPVSGLCPLGTDQMGTFLGAVCVLTMHLSSTTVPIFPGNSGSPVLNSSGRVVGVINSADGATNYGYFIPLPYVKDFLKDPSL